MCHLRIPRQKMWAVAKVLGNDRASTKPKNRARFWAPSVPEVLYSDVGNLCRSVVIVILVDLGQFLFWIIILYKCTLSKQILDDIGPMFLPSERRCLKGSWFFSVWLRISEYWPFGNFRAAVRAKWHHSGLTWTSSGELVAWLQEFWWLNLPTKTGKA